VDSFSGARNPLRSTPERGRYDSSMRSSATIAVIAVCGDHAGGGFTDYGSDARLARSWLTSIALYCNRR